LNEVKDVHPLQIIIGENQIGLIFKCKIEGGKSVVNRCDLVTFLPEGQFNEFLNGQIIVDEEYSSGHLASGFCGYEVQVSGRKNDQKLPYDFGVVKERTGVAAIPGHAGCDSSSELKGPY
jgi:hypothetical protein